MMSDQILHVDLLEYIHPERLVPCRAAAIFQVGRNVMCVFENNVGKLEPYMQIVRLRNELIGVCHVELRKRETCYQLGDYETILPGGPSNDMDSDDNYIMSWDYPDPDFAVFYEHIINEINEHGIPSYYLDI